MTRKGLIRCFATFAMLTGIGMFVSLDAGPPLRAPEEIEGAESILAIYLNDMSIWVKGHDELIFAAWPDGTMVWSENWTSGGAPYKRSKIDPAAIQGVFQEFKSAAYYESKALNSSHFGPHGPFVTILAKDGQGNVLKMESWHELMGDPAEDVDHDAIQKLAPLSPRDPFEVGWQKARGLMRRLVPDESSPSSGCIERQEGRPVWKWDCDR